MAQIISIIDAYAFQPMMRQAFTNRVVCKKFNLPTDEEAFANAMVESKTVLRAINHLTENSIFLCGDDISLADLQFAPVVDYFQAFEEGRELLNESDKILTWYNSIRTRPSIKDTRPSI